ncbi:MAG: PadR family transcriptional regulator [Candidatus Aenigmarchaeota archaeon]|nr:PadR family transcriptional regulator [Candidatus Aenigmarchaeota archaeon]
MKTEESFLTNLTKLYVLVALHKSPKHGYELMSDFLKITGKNLSAGQVYPLLNSMRKNGLVDVSSAYEGQRERKVYSLTDEGRVFRETVLGQLRDLLAYGGVCLS